jgi:hypothetical protein
MIKMDRCYDNRYWDMIKIQNEDKEYPPNMGQKWTDQEETLLLEELDKNININIIAQNHNRTLGGIICRQKEIAYKMYFTPFLISNAHFEMRFINKMRKGVKWANLPITSTTITIISTIITTAIFITTIVIITIHKSMIATLTLYS